jgi:hypothetical protein
MLVVRRTRGPAFELVAASRGRNVLLLELPRKYRAEAEACKPANLLTIIEISQHRHPAVEIRRAEGRLRKLD